MTQALSQFLLSAVFPPDHYLGSLITVASSRLVLPQFPSPSTKQRSSVPTLDARDECKWSLTGRGHPLREGGGRLRLLPRHRDRAPHPPRPGPRRRRVPGSAYPGRWSRSTTPLRGDRGRRRRGLPPSGRSCAHRGSRAGLVSRERGSLDSRFWCAYLSLREMTTN